MGGSIAGGGGSYYKRRYEYLKEENKRNRDLIKKLEAEIKELKQVKNLTMLDVSNNKVALIDFLIHLNDKGLINNHDFDYEKEAKKYIKKLINGC